MSAASRPYVIAICGWKNSGKTTLVTKLVTWFRQRGLRVATVKHAHHGFDLDQEGTDSARHRKAGANETVIVSARRWALLHEVSDEAEPMLADMVARLSPSDVVIAEGFKRASVDKIEIVADPSAELFWQTDERVIALAVAPPIANCPLVQLSRDDIDGLARLIANHGRLDLGDG